MKFYKNIFVCLGLLSFGSLAFSSEKSIFTTLAFPSEKVSYVGVKTTAKGAEPESSILEIKTEKMISSKIKLPDDISNREIVALIPAKKENLLVLTQYTMERGDHPKLHAYNTAKKSWKLIGEVACISFAKLKLAGDKIIFSCEEADASGDVKMVEKEIKVAPYVTLEKSELILPIAKLEKGALKAQFEGLPQEWEKLKLTYKNNSKNFTP